MTGTEDLAKHPLEHKWTLWFDSKKTQKEGKSWEENLHKVADFETVEAFWGMYNHIKRPSKLDIGANYHLFKSGIKPMWEDEQNKQGGKWLLTLVCKDEEVNDIWEHLILAMVGEHLEEGEGLPGGLVTGAVMGKRRQNSKIAVWTKIAPKQDAEHRRQLEALGQRMREVLPLKGDQRLEFFDHEEIAQQGFSAKPVLVEGE